MAVSGARRFTMTTAMAEAAAMEAVRYIEKELDKYLYMRHMHHENPALFYKLLIHNAQELLPVVYAPTVGQVYLDYSKLPIHIHGLVIRPEHKGRVYKKIKEWSGIHRVRVVVVTDGERVLGLGDLGFNGMAIAEGKILLYTVMAGVNPAVCMPCVLDVGTNNEALLADPTYKGIRQKRLRGAEYDDLVDEFMAAVKSLHDHTLLQFEDFGNANAFRFLEKYSPVQCSFNDDIQGTACIALAGVFSALRITGKSIADQRIVVLGAGEAGTGVGQLICKAIRAETKLTEEESLQRCFYLDSKGLICSSRTDLQHHKLPFAHDVPFISNLLDAGQNVRTLLNQLNPFLQVPELEAQFSHAQGRPDLHLLSSLSGEFFTAVKELKPTILVGASTQGGAFTKEICEVMAENNERPIIFPLSNPTIKSEVKYADAFAWTKGKVIFASGSPYNPLEGPDGKMYYPAQANNAYIFGPMGMAALLTHCRQITDEVFLQAAKILAGLTPRQHIESGMLFPTIGDMKDLAVPLMAGIAEFMVTSKLGRKPAAVESWPDYIKSQMYQPGVAPTPVVEVRHVVTRELLFIRNMYTDIQRYLFLRHLQDAQPDKFWGLMINNAQELLPYVYTPTVGEACEKYSNLPIKTRGLYIRQEDSGKILQKLQAWRHQEIKVIVVTDGERILGLGDLGSGGMGISEGKIILYTVFGGVDPKHGLPVCIDVGTNRDSLIQDHQYAGVIQKRLGGEKYDALIHEFILALKKWQPHVLLQFEDFGNTNAFKILEKYKKVLCCFNDDIQGTACITLTGILSALRVTGKRLDEQKILLFGAGEAGTGIGQIIAYAVVQTCKIPMKEALKFCYYVDSKGFVCKSRSDLQQHKLPFAHDIPFQPDLLSAVKAVKPTILIGVSTITGAFTKEVLQAMRQFNERPIVFPLSNPTSRAECTFEEAYQHTGGSVVFASGSPFPSFVTSQGKTLYPAQANNAYVFGPIGMAAVLTKCKTITEDLFWTTAELLAGITPEARLDSGMLFPAFSDMKEVAPHLIAGICEYIVKSGQGTQPADATDWLDYVKAKMYKPPDEDTPP